MIPIILSIRPDLTAAACAASGNATERPTPMSSLSTPSIAGRRLARRRVLALIASLALVLVACGGDGAPSAEDQAAGGESDDAAALDAGGGDADTDSASQDTNTDGEAVAEDAADDLLVVTTTSILGDIVATLVGDDGEVVTLMPPGVDPHGYQPSAADAAQLRQADLVIANGLDLEEGLLSALEGAEAEGVTVVTVADQLDPLEFDDGHGHDDDDGHGHDDDDGHGHDDDGHGHDDDDGHGQDDDGHGHDDDDGHGHDHGPEDPHVWLDPVRMADGAQLIAAELAAVDSAVDAADWEARGEAYAQELLAVHAEMDEALAVVPDERRLLVTNHDALGYFAYRFDFEVIGTVIPGSTTQAETDAQQFGELVRVVEEAEVPAIFAENTDSTTLAEQLASEVVGRGDLEVEVVRLYTDALGEPGSGAETYPDLLRTNAGLIADALG
jgi:zinc/manganese transport system substrate-binding protein